MYTIYFRQMADKHEQAWMRRSLRLTSLVLLMTSLAMVAGGGWVMADSLQTEDIVRKDLSYVVMMML